MGNSLLFQDTLLHIVISIYEFVHCLIPLNLTHPHAKGICLNYQGVG